MPKSSSAMWTPSARSWLSATSAASSSAISTASVISSSSRRGSSPVSASAAATFNGSACDLNWTGETLTASADVRGPGGRFGACGSQHPLPDLLDQAGLLGNGNKIRRRNHAAHRMPPAQQRFASGYLIAVQVHQRLIVNFEAAFHERYAQIALEFAAEIGLRLHAGSKNRWVLRPAALAAYIARSALFSSPSRSEPWRGAIATPMLASALRRWPWQSNDVRSAWLICAIRALTSSSDLMPHCTTANSSPPRRATKSSGPMQPRRRSETVLRNSSPIRWPSESLMRLNSSMSM